MCFFCKHIKLRFAASSHKKRFASVIFLFLLVPNTLLFSVLLQSQSLKVASLYWFIWSSMLWGLTGLRDNVFEKVERKIVDFSCWRIEFERAISGLADIKYPLRAV